MYCQRYTFVALRCTRNQHLESKPSLELLIEYSDPVVIADCLPFYFGYEQHMHGRGQLGYPRGWGSLPYMGYIGVGGRKGYGFQ